MLFCHSSLIVEHDDRIVRIQVQPLGVALLTKAVYVDIA